MKKIRWMTIAVFLVSFTSPFSQLWADEEKNAPPPASSRSGSGADVEAGKAIYFKRCVYCHGEQGKGDGFSTDFLRPRPRDFTRGLYKYRTTALKALPTDEDLFKVVTDGLPGTGMPAWSMVLSEPDRRDVIAFIKTFSDRFKSETAPKPLAVGKEPASNAEMIAKGEKLFHSKATCFMCHGQAGRGDGPLAPTLKDDWGDPISPRNLTKTWQYRGGPSATDIFTRISTGINGTPMPSFAEQLTEEERWQVVQYVKSIQKQNPDVQPVVLKGVRIDGPLPTEPDDPKWGEAPLIRYPLVGQVIREPRMFKPSITDIEVKALYNDKELALLLAWDDPTQTQPNPAGGVFEDAVAVQFPTALTATAKKPYFLMGDDKSSVYLWTWKTKSNLLRESNANGIDKERPQPETSQTLKGKGIYKDGEYRVVFSRSLATADLSNEIQFKPGQFVPMAFSAWDGSNGESETKRAISHWYYILLEPPTPKSVYIYPPLVVAAALGVQFWVQRRLRQKAKG